MTALPIAARVTQLLDRVDERARTMSPVRAAKGLVLLALVAAGFAVGVTHRLVVRGYGASKRWIIAACSEGYQAGRGKQR